MLTPEQRDAWQLRDAVILSQFDLLLSILPQYSERQGLPFSRAAALKAAEELILHSSMETATKWSHSHPIETVSLARLVQHLREGFLSPGAYKPSEIAVQDFPFQALCSWIVTLLPKVSGSWASDEDPVIPEDKQHPLPEEEE